MLRLVLILPVAVLCAVWPQGLVLCMGSEGHVEFEIAGSPCCPEEGESESEDCRGCVDCDSPELVRAPAAAPIARDADGTARETIVPEPALRSDAAPPLAASSSLAALSTVMLLV